MGQFGKKFAVSLRGFAKDTSGAVSVDWVVLTSALTGLAIGVTAVMFSGVSKVAAEIERELYEGDYIMDTTALDDDVSNFVPLSAGEIEARLAAMDLETYSAAQKQNRWEQLNVISETAVLAQHETWNKNANKSNFGNPGKARDEVKLIDLAMEARNITPS